MALTRPEIWRNVALAGLRKDLVADKVCNTSFQQEVWKKGDTLNIRTLTALADAAYDSNNITYSDITSADTALTIDKERYVAIIDQDTNAMLTGLNAQAELMTDMGHQLADYFDALVCAEYANAGIDSYSTGTTAWQMTATTAASVVQLFSSLRKDLRAANAPNGEIYFIAPPEIEQAVNMFFGGKAASAKADDVLTNGFAGKYMGVNLFISNNLTTASSVTHGLAGVMGTSIALASDIMVPEPIRLEGQFATGYRALGVGGVKTFRSAISIDVNLNETVIATS